MRKVAIDSLLGPVKLIAAQMGMLWVIHEDCLLECARYGGSDEAGNRKRHPVQL